MAQDQKTPLVSSLSDAESVTPFGIQMHIMMPSEATGGTFSALHVTHQPGEGPPRHMHEHQDEYVYVLEGVYEVMIGDATHRAQAGTMLFLPRNTIHSFKNIGTEPAKMLDWSLPGGQDGYFREIAKAAQQHGFGEEMMKKTADINARHSTSYHK